jgi:hypothetical protein
MRHHVDSLEKEKDIFEEVFWLSLLIKFVDESDLILVVPALLPMFRFG